MRDLTLPNGWKWSNLASLAEVVSGGTPSRNEPSFWENGSVPWATPTDITACPVRVLTTTAELISEKGLRASAARILPKNTVLMTSRATLGEARLAGVECCTNQGFKSLVPKPGQVAEFLFYQMQLQKERYEALGTGSTFLEVNKKQTDSFEIPEAPEPQQRRIAKILTTVDNQIEKTEALIAKYQSIKQGLMHDLFTRGVDEHGRLRPGRDDAPQLYKESALGWIPMEWDVRVVNNLVSPSRPVVYGILMPGYGWPGGVPVIKVKDIQEGQVITTDLLLTSPEIDASYRRSKTQVGDLLFTIRGSVGRMAFVPATLPNANITQDTARIGVVGADPRFVRGALETPAAKRFIKVHTLGVAVQGINLGDVRRIPILFPPLKEQGRIGDRIEAADKRIDAEVDWLDKLRVLKLGLMQDLLTGKVPVKPKPKDQDHRDTPNGQVRAGVKPRAEGVHA